MADDSILICAACGGKNRVPQSAIGGAAKARCGHCGATLSTTPPEDGDIRAAVIEPAATKRKGGRFLVGFLIGAVVASAALFLVDRRSDLQMLEVAGFSPARWLDRYLPPSPDSETPPPEPEIAVAPEPEAAPAVEPEAEIADAETPDTEASEPEAALEPTPVAPPDAIEVPPAPPTADSAPLIQVPVTPGILFDWTNAESLAPFTVKTSPGRDYYVKLVYEGTNTDAIGIYIQGGVENEVSIPLGRYEMRYASGTTWYGLNDLFGPDTAYAKTDTTLDFREEDGEYKGYTIELILQEGGNLNTVGIAREEF